MTGALICKQMTCKAVKRAVGLFGEYKNNYSEPTQTCEPYITGRYGQGNLEGWRVVVNFDGYEVKTKWLDAADNIVDVSLVESKIDSHIASL